MSNSIYLFFILMSVCLPKLNCTRIRIHSSKRENPDIYRPSVDSGIKVENGKIYQYNKNHIKASDPMDEGHRIFLKLKENGLLDMFMRNRQPIKELPTTTTTSTTTTTTTTTPKPEEQPVVKTSAHVGHDSNDNNMKHTKWQLYTPEKETINIPDSDLAQSQVHHSIDPIYASLAFSNIVTRPSVQPQVTEQTQQIISHWETKQPTVPDSENLIQDEVSINFPNKHVANQSADTPNVDNNEITLIPVVETDTYIILFKNISSSDQHFMFKAEKPELEFAHHVINTLIQKITSTRDDVRPQSQPQSQPQPQPQHEQPTTVEDYFAKNVKRKVPDTATASSETNYQVHAQEESPQSNKNESKPVSPAPFTKQEESENSNSVIPPKESEIQQHEGKLYLLSVNNPTENVVPESSDKNQLRLTELNHNSIPLNVMKFYEEYLRNVTAKPVIETNQNVNPVSYSPQNIVVEETTVTPIQTTQESIPEQNPLKSESTQQIEQIGEYPPDIMQLIEKYSKSQEFKDKLLKIKEASVQVSPQYSTIRANQDISNVNVKLPKPVYTPNSYLEDLSQLYSKTTLPPQETQSSTNEKYSIIVREKPAKTYENEQSYSETNPVQFMSSTPTAYTKFINQNSELYNTDQSEQLRPEREIIPEKFVQSETKNLRHRYRIVTSNSDKSPMYKIVLH